MPRIPSNDPTPNTLSREIVELRRQIALLQDSIASPPKQPVVKEIVFSHDDKVVLYARSVPYVVQSNGATINSWTVGAKTAPSNDTSIAIFIDNVVADTVVLEAGTRVAVNPELDIPVEYTDTIQVAVVSGGAKLSGLSVILTIEEDV